jgi:hypothetical protein
MAKSRHTCILSAWDLYIFGEQITGFSYEAQMHFLSRWQRCYPTIKCYSQESVIFSTSMVANAELRLNVHNMQ